MGWRKMKLGEVIKNREGRYKPNSPDINGLKRIDKINFSGQIFLSDKSSNTDMILVKKGDLIISGINVEKGALAVYEGEEDILATIHYSSYIFDTAKIDIDFLKVFLRSPDFVQVIKEQVPGGIKTEIKPKHILPLEVYFPETTTEQKAIAQHFFEKEAKLNQLDENFSHQLTLLENLNQAILQEAVQGKLVPQDPNDEPASELLRRIKAEKSKSGKKEKPLPPVKAEEIPFEIPESWVWCRLGEIAESTSGGTPDRSNPKYWNGNVSWLKSGELTDSLIENESEEKITEEGFKNSSAKLFPQGTLLIALYGATAGKLGILKFESTTNQAVCGFFENEYYVTKYLFYYLWAFKRKIIKDSWGQAQPNISQTYLKNFPLAFPPLFEQTRIVTEIEKQFAKTRQLKEHIIANQQATGQLLKALLHRAFETGAELEGQEV
jgi:type I restriction enzyme S subunit